MKERVILMEAKEEGREEGRAESEKEILKLTAEIEQLKKEIEILKATATS